LFLGEVAFNLVKGMKNQNQLRPHQAAFMFAALASVVFWFVPFLRWVTVPLQYLNTHIHEGWHALTAVATGGMVSHIEVHANGNGETYTLGGMNFLISSAGYLGAALTGSLIIALARTPKAAKVALVALSVFIAYLLIVWVRRDVFGIVSAAAWIAALWGIAFYTKEETKLFLIQFFGVQQCLNSIQSLFFLVQISGFGIKQSDAGNMENMTHVPAIIWAGLWCLVSLVLMFFALKFSWRSIPKTDSPEPEWAQ
jgi:hypothetical protein